MGEWILAFMPFWAVGAVLFVIFARRVRTIVGVFSLVCLAGFTVLVAPALALDAAVDREVSMEAEERYGVEFVLGEPTVSTGLSEDITPEERKHSHLATRFFLLEEGEFMTVEYTDGENDENGVVVKREGEFILLDSDGREHVKEDA